jgi:hypothetical protein
MTEPGAVERRGGGDARLFQVIAENTGSPLDRLISIKIGRDWYKSQIGRDLLGAKVKMCNPVH